MTRPALGHYALRMPGNNAALVEEARTLFTPNYRPAPIVIARGRGAEVFDEDGARYLDLVGGIAVSALGHDHPRLVAAIREQAGRVLHTSNLYLNRPSIDLARRLVSASFGERVFFCNSGAEANEAQIKLARRFAFDRGEKDRTKIVAFEHSFHGRTYGALAATGQPKYHEGFAPMPAGFAHIPYGDVAALERAVDGETAALLVEPIQGESGVRIPPDGFLAACRRACDRSGALLLFDEVQVGLGRTGTLFAHEHDGVRPDVMSLAKGLGGGLPLGAIVATAIVGDHLAYGSHATTFGGNPVACAAGCVVLEVLREPGFLDHVARIGRRLEAGLSEIGRRRRCFREVRGRGLLLGAVLEKGLPFDAKAIVDACRLNGALVHVAGADVVRLAPPLVLTEPEADEGLHIIDRSIAGLSSQ